jgi:glycosyltransferase involved in cell wall biosynthesis
MHLSPSESSTFEPLVPVTATPRPRIALVAAGREILGGQEVQARALITGLKREGYAVDFIPINPAFPRGFRWLRRFPYLRTLLNQALYLPSLLALRHADIVHVFSASYWSFLLAPVPAMLVARALGKHVVLHYHSGEAWDHLLNWGVLVHPGLRLAHEIVVPSEYLRQVFAGSGYQVRVIRNVVNTGHFQFRERKPLRPRLLSVRNFERHYRVDITLAAFALIKTHLPEATLTLAGTGSEEQRLRKMAASLSVNGIFFAGRVDPQAIAALYDKCDIFINASVVDNQPVSVLEAFAAGLPVISTATGDIAAMVRHEETGLIVAPDDPASIAGAVVQLLERPDLAISIARRSRREVERYTWGCVHQAWAAAYAGINA